MLLIISKVILILWILSNLIILPKISLDVLIDNKTHVDVVKANLIKNDDAIFMKFLIIFMSFPALTVSFIIISTFKIFEKIFSI